MRLIGLIDTITPPAFQVADHADQELRHVLQVDRQPVAGREAVRQQRRGERVALRVELARG